jgi:hypothetical protein
MAVMGERLPEAWIVEWHRNGRVEFPLRRWAFLQYPIFVVLGYSILLAGKLPDMLADDVWRFAGYLVIVAYVGIAIAIVRMLVTQRPYVVVDRVGIHRGRRSMPWSEIADIAELDGAPGDRFFTVVPSTRGRKLRLGQEHVRNVPAFRYWLTDLLAEHRRTASSP